MAKYNMMLGVAAGSVGDIVLSRQNGKQIQRVRVHEVANPKTEGQAAQRSFVAPVTKFYSPLAIALERSWESMNKGQSYSAFLKYNTQLARDRQWALPKGTGFFPLPFRVSKGLLPALPQYFTVSEGDGILTINAKRQLTFQPLTTVGGLSACLISAGYHEHDQITFILVRQTNYDDIYAQDAFIPTHFRFYLDPDSTVQLTEYGLNATVGDVGAVWTFNQSNVCAACVIISRYERGQWRRTTQNLMVDENILNVINSPSERIANINTYRPPVDFNPSDVYLNGSTSSQPGLSRNTRAGEPVSVVRIMKGNVWAMAVGEDDQKYFVYSDDRSATSYQKCLKSDGTWDTADGVTTYNSIGFSFQPNGENAEENLLFFMNSGFTYAQLLNY